MLPNEREGSAGLAGADPIVRWRLGGKSDRCAKAVHKITADGKVTAVAESVQVADSDKDIVEGTPKDELPYLRGLAVDARGTVYAAATGCRCVVKITADGKVETVLKAERTWSPTGIAVQGEDKIGSPRDSTMPEEGNARVKNRRSFMFDSRLPVLIFSVLFVLPLTVEGQPQTGEPHVAGAPAVQLRKDRYGDPLPSGAIARMGTVRFRHAYDVSDLVFFPDGKRVISASEDGTIRVWDARTGEELRRLTGERAGVLAVALSHDGKIV